jgi:hypothetical protein
VQQAGQRVDVDTSIGRPAEEPLGGEVVQGSENRARDGQGPPVVADGADEPEIDQVGMGAGLE